MKNPFSFIWSHVYTHHLLPNDDLIQRSRKLVLAVFFLTSFVMAADCLVTVCYVLKGKMNAGDAVAYSGSSLGYCIGNISAWVVMRKRKRAGETMMVMWGVLMIFLDLWVICTAPYHSIYMLLMPIPVAVMVLDMQHSIRFVVCGFVMCLVNTYNMVYGVDNDAAIAVYTVESDSTQLLAMHASGIAFFVLISALLKLQSVEYKHVIDTSASSAQVSRGVTELLLHYNTDAATKLVTAYAATESADAGTVATLQSMINNMECYRPFLPNYVLDNNNSNNNTSEEDGRKRDADAIAENDSDADTVSAYSMARAESPSLGAMQQPMPRRGSVVESVLLPSSNSSSNLMRNIDASILFGGVHAVSLEPSSPQQHENSTSSYTVTPVIPIENTSPPSDVALDDDRGSAPVIPQMLAPPPQQQPQPTPLQSLSRQRVTLAVVCYKPIFTASSPTIPLGHRAKIVTCCVDQLFEIAEQTRASIHSFYGDYVHVSWNAARRVPQHETRALQFLSRCRDSVQHTVGCTAAALVTNIQQTVPISSFETESSNSQPRSSALMNFNSSNATNVSSSLTRSRSTSASPTTSPTTRGPPPLPSPSPTSPNSSSSKNLYLFGAVSTGEGLFMFSGTRQKVPIAHVSWQSDLDVLLHRYARPLETFVCCGVCAENASHAVLTLRFHAFVSETLPTTQTAPTPTTHELVYVHEIISESVNGAQRWTRGSNSSVSTPNNFATAGSSGAAAAQTSKNANEWMYEIEQQGVNNSAYHTVGLVVDEALKGNFFAAEELLACGIRQDVRALPSVEFLSSTLYTLNKKCRRRTHPHSPTTVTSIATTNSALLESTEMLSGGGGG
eukprot:PhM_4_TR13733/c0_g1_i1/m.25165